MGLNNIMIKHNKIPFISFLQFIGPIFVIIGHSSNLLVDEKTAYWLFSKTWIYSFHMPLFFFVSGYLFKHNGGIRDGILNFVIKKFKRLIIPYIIWNAMFFVPKFLFAEYTVDQVQFSIPYLIKVFFSPRENILGHTWFLFALFEVFLCSILLIRVKSKCLKVLVSVFLLVLRFIPINTTVLALSDLRQELIWFWCGMILGELDLNIFMGAIKQHKKFFMSSTAIVSVLYLIIKPANIYVSTTLCPLVIATLISFSPDCSDKIDWLSSRSFSIYLLHWPVMYAIRTLMIQYTQNPYFVVPVLLASGYLIPVAIVYFIGKIPKGKIGGIIKYIICY